MRKIICILASILFLCSCSTTDNVSANEIIINMPTDNTVNGYRTEEDKSSQNKMPSTLPIDEVKPADPSTDNGTTYKYIGNSNSHVFHEKSCSSVKNMKEENKVAFKTRDDAIQKNYSPCKRCNP